MNEETPTHSYHRRRTEEMSGSELTNHRLKNLEEGVRQITTGQAASHAVLGEINIKLALGAQRFDNQEDRLVGLERDRRWIVLSFITGGAGLIWQALTALFKHSSIVVFCVLLAGCGQERAQAGADARSGLTAAKQSIADGKPAIAGTILEGVDKRLPAATGVNSADWPAPKLAPPAIIADPKAYSDSAPPEPDRILFWSGITAGALGLLAIARQLAPAIPGIGPLWAGAVNVAYAIAQHSAEKQLDAADQHAKLTIDSARPLLDLLRTRMPDQFGQLPESVQTALNALIDSKAPPA